MKRLILTLLVACFGFAAHAQQAFPNRAIKLVVPFAAGSTIDMLGRAIGQGLSEKLGQPVVIENKPGAGSSVGAVAVANSQPDGYTLLLGTNATFAVNPILYKKLPYDPADFKVIATTGGSPSFLMVGGQSKFRNLADLIKAAKEHPGSVKYASSGIGSTGHLVGEVLAAAAGVQLLHIPYKDGPQALTATITGEVDAIFYPSGAALPMINAGRVRPLAVSTKRRTVDLPKVPTIAESGYPNFDLTGWTVIAVPVKTPAAVVDRLRDAIISVYGSPAYEAKLDALGLVPQKLVNRDVEDFVQTEQHSMAEVAKRANIKAE